MFAVEVALCYELIFIFSKCYYLKETLVISIFLILLKKKHFDMYHIDFINKQTQ